MESNYQPQPDLASILQTLRAYAPSQQQAHAAPHQSQAFQSNSQPQIPPQAPDLEEGEYDPSAYDPSLPLITTPHPQAPAPPPQQQPPTTQPQQYRKPTPTSHHPLPSQLTPTTNPPPSTTTVPKTPTITTWPPALRHITALAASTPAFLPRIRHLISTQHAHERTWWSGRQELQKRLAGREEGRKRLDSVLGSLGGGRIDLLSTTTTKRKKKEEEEGNGEELSEEEQELRGYDRKVYRACKDMAAATAKELRKLEVPFFCVMDGLVSEKGDGKAQGKRKGTISEQELVELRGRMMGLLEDLCGED